VNGSTWIEGRESIMELTAYIEGEEFLEEMSDCQLLEKNCYHWIWFFVKLIVITVAIICCKIWIWNHFDFNTHLLCFSVKG
jgi:hypothetical protein